MKYDEYNRGKIQYRDRARQLIDFRGIRYNNITPTDIDGFFEKNNKIFVFYEYKLKGAKMPYGQELSYERLVDNLQVAGKAAVLFLCKHEEYDPKRDISGSEAKVEKIYYGGHWYAGTAGSISRIVAARTGRRTG
jgi:hypothetical protein